LFIFEIEIALQISTRTENSMFNLFSWNGSFAS